MKASPIDYLQAAIELAEESPRDEAGFLTEESQQSVLAAYGMVDETRKLPKVHSSPMRKPRHERGSQVLHPPKVKSFGYSFGHWYEAKSLQSYYSKAIGGGQTPGVPFQGPSGRWFVIRPSDNRVVPTKTPGTTAPAPKQPKAKKPTTPKPAAKKPAAKPVKPPKPAKVVPPKPTAAQLQQAANQHVDDLVKKVNSNEKLSAKERKLATAHLANLPLSDLQAQASKLGLSSTGTKQQLEASIEQALKAYKPLTVKQLKVKRAEDFLASVKTALDNKQALSAQDLLDLPKHLKELKPGDIDAFIKSLAGGPDAAKGKATNIKRLVEFAKAGGVVVPKLKKARTAKPKTAKAAVAATKKPLSFHDQSQRDDIDDLVEIALEELKEQGKRVDYNDLGTLMALKGDIWKSISPAFEAGSNQHSILDRSLRGLQSQRATIMLPPTFGSTPRGPNSNTPKDTRPELNDKEKAALQSYTGTTYRTLNKFQREQGKPPGKLKQVHEGLEAAFHKATIFDKPVKVTRSVTLDSANTAAYVGALQASMNAGTPHNFGQVLSTSTNPNPPGGGSHNIEVRVNVVHGLDVRPYSHCPQANEIILHQDSNYKVNSIKQDPISGRWIAELDQLAPDWAGEAGTEQELPTVIKPAGQIDDNDLRKLPVHPGLQADLQEVRDNKQDWEDLSVYSKLPDLEKVHYHLGLKKPDDYDKLSAYEKKNEMAYAIAKHVRWQTPVAYKPAGYTTDADISKLASHIGMHANGERILKEVMKGKQTARDMSTLLSGNKLEQIAHHLGVEEPAGYGRMVNTLDRREAMAQAIAKHLTTKPPPGPGFFQRVLGGQAAPPPTYTVPTPYVPPTPVAATPAKPAKKAAPVPKFPPPRPAQPAKTFSAPHDSQTVQDILAGKQLHTYHRNTAGGGREDTALNEILHESGRANPPAIHDAAGIDNLAKQGWTVSYRSVKEPHQIDQFRSGDMYNGSGIFGNGTYVAAAKGALSEDEAKQHTKIYGTHTMRVALPPTAKVISLTNLHQQQGKYLSKLEKDFKAKKISAIDYMRHKALVRDEGRFAALHNYDAIDAGTGLGGNNYMVILNRSICAVQKDNV